MKSFIQMFVFGQNGLDYPFCKNMARVDDGVISGSISFKAAPRDDTNIRIMALCCGAPT